jgi:spore maturation protein SpmA
MGVSPVVGIATGVLVGPALKAVALTLPRAHLDAATLGAVWSYGLLGVLALWPGRNRLAQGPADTVMEFD